MKTMTISFFLPKATMFEKRALIKYESHQGRTQEDIQLMSTEFFLSYWDKSSINFYKPIKEKRDT